MNGKEFRKSIQQASERIRSGFGFSAAKKIKAVSALKHGLQSYHATYLMRQDPRSNLLQEASRALRDLDSANSAVLTQAMLTLLRCYSSYGHQMSANCNPLDFDGQILALQGMLHPSAMLSQSDIDECVDSLCKRLDQGATFSDAFDMGGMLAAASIASGKRFY